jgi:Zn-dependent protease
MAPQGRPPRSGLQPRTVAWIIAGLVVVILLVRSRHLNESTVFIIVAVIPSIILHEVAHGVAALACGDDTAKRAGRLTLNPVHHFDPLGTLIMPVLMALTVYGAVGWAKPMPVTPSRLRHPKNQKVLVALAGVATNLVLAVVLGLAWKLSTRRRSSAWGWRRRRGGHSCCSPPAS